MKHRFSISTNDPFQVVTVHYVRDSGLVSVEVSSTRLSTAKALDIVPTYGGHCHTPPNRVGRGVVHSG